MSGLKLVVPTTFTNTNLPYLRDDIVLPKTGALMLIDPTHPASAWGSSVPANNEFLPNIAASLAQPLLGTGKETRPKMLKPATFTGTAGLIERTSKGGLHGISPQAGTAVLNSGPAITFHTDLMAYILANPQHDYYGSFWGRVTRRQIQAYGSGTIFSINSSGQQTNSFLLHGATAGTPATNRWTTRPAYGDPTADLLLGSTETPVDSQVGNKFIALATSRWFTATAGLNNSLPGDGTNQSVTGSYAGGGLPFGSAISWEGIGATGTKGTGTFTNQGSSGNVSGSSPVTPIKDALDSHIVYRFYLEDLTVSGRTHAQVSAIDLAEYTKHVLTAGGRYFGDTFTDPATIP